MVDKKRNIKEYAPLMLAGAQMLNAVGAYLDPEYASKYYAAIAAQSKTNEVPQTPAVTPAAAPVLEGVTVEKMVDEEKP